MNKLSLAILLLSAAAIAPAADNSVLSGKWQVHSVIGGTENDQACTFIQKDNTLTGNCTSDQGTVKITGKVEEKKISWSYESEYNGTPLTAKYSGRLDSTNKITGAMSVEAFGVEGEFTATQSKQE